MCTFQLTTGQQCKDFGWAAMPSNPELPDTIACAITPVAAGLNITGVLPFIGKK